MVLTYISQTILADITLKGKNKVHSRFVKEARMTKSNHLLLAVKEHYVWVSDQSYIYIKHMTQKYCLQWVFMKWALFTAQSK